MSPPRRLLGVVALGVALLAAFAAGPAVTLADHDPQEPHNDTQEFDDEEASSPINVTWSRTYWDNATVNTTKDGRQWNVKQSRVIADAGEGGNGEYVFTGTATTWDAPVDQFQSDALLMRTGPDGAVVHDQFHGRVAPEGVSRTVECLDLSDTSGQGREFLEGRVEQYDGLPRPANDDPRCFTNQTLNSPSPVDNPNAERDTFRHYNDKGQILTTTDDGGALFIGTTSSFVDYGDVFNESDSQTWVVKTDENGAEEWNRTVDNEAQEWEQTLNENGWGGNPRDVVQTEDGGYLLVGVTDYGRYDVWALKLDAQGNMEWQDRYGGSEDDEAYEVIRTSDGNYAIAGESYSYGDNDDDQINDAWLLTIDSDGNEVINETYSANAVAPRSETAYEGAFTVTEAPDGGFVLGGDTTAYADGSIDDDAWVIRTDENGKMQWNRSFGGSDEFGTTEAEIARDVVTTHDGGLLFAGIAESEAITTDQRETWLVKMNDSGAKQWEETVNRGDITEPGTLLATSDGEYLLTVSTNAFADLEREGWIPRTHVLKFSDEMTLGDADESDSDESDSDDSDADESDSDESDADESDSDSDEDSQSTPTDSESADSDEDSQSAGGDSEQSTASDTSQDETTPGSSGPGFGVVATVLAVLASAILARRT